jgi:hypothetical protein
MWELLHGNSAGSASERFSTEAGHNSFPLKLSLVFQAIQNTFLPGH